MCPFAWRPLCSLGWELEEARPDAGPRKIQKDGCEAGWSSHRGMWKDLEGVQGLKIGGCPNDVLGAEGHCSTPVGAPEAPRMAIRRDLRSVECAERR